MEPAVRLDDERLQFQICKTKAPGARKGEAMVRRTEQIVEEQVLRWQLERRDAKLKKPPKKAPPAVIVISNAYGSNANPIGQAIGDITGFKVYDREIVYHIATHAKVRLETVETLDQRAQSWIDDFLTGLFREKGFYQDQYAQELTRTIVSLWHHGPCVMIGHGCCHVVPRSHSLAVRTTASETRRAMRIQNLEQLTTLEQARKRMERMDAERAAFVRKFFTVRIDDGLAYDMVLNTDRFDTRQAAQAIVDVFMQRFPEEAKPVPENGWSREGAEPSPWRR
jgi:cytidylate kinase